MRRRPPPSPTAGSPTVHQLLRSRELWATIDICNAPDQPNTVGIRGSMPGDGKTADKMYMEFGLEYIDAVNQWAVLPSSSSGWVLVGSGSGARQGGWSFTLKPPNSRGKFTLRGTVTFRWMRGGTRQLARTTLPTTGGRKVPRGRRPGRLQRRPLRPLAQASANRRGSLVMIPSTPIEVSLAISRASSTVHTYS